MRRAVRNPVWWGIAVYAFAAAVSRGGLLTHQHPGDVGHYSTFAHEVAQGQIPYRDFYVEYPPLALLPFVIPQVWASHYLDVFKVVMFLCGALMLYVAAAIPERSERNWRVPLALAVSPLLIGPVFLTRYDLFPALLAVGCLLALSRGRTRLSFVLLAATVGAKLFAVAVLPVALIHVWRTSGRSETKRAVVAFALASLLIWGPFIALAPGGVRFSLQSQLERGLQIESLGASVLLVLDKLGIYNTHWVRGLAIELGGNVPRVVGALTSMAELGAIAAVALLYRQARLSRSTLVTAYLTSVVAFVVFAKVLSPQYLIWLIPLVPIASGRRARVITWAFLAALLLTQLEVNYGDWGLRNVDWSVWLLAVRNALLVAIFIQLFRNLVAARSDK